MTEGRPALLGGRWRRRAGGALRSAGRRRLIVGVTVVVGTLLFGWWAKLRIDGLSLDTQSTSTWFRWEYLFVRERTPDELKEMGRQHVQLTVVPVLAGVVISAGLTAVGRRVRWLLAPIYAFGAFLYAVPSLALFGILSTYQSNETAATIALTSYTLLIITRNMVEGLDGVSPAALDAADGMGMSRWQRLWRVEVPLALPAILTGIRVATVTTVGLVGISAVIQLGGFAFLIFDGYERQYTTPMILGTVLSVALAVSLDLVLRGVGRIASPWARRGAAR